MDEVKELKKEVEALKERVSELEKKTDIKEIEKALYKFEPYDISK